MLTCASGEDFQLVKQVQEFRDIHIALKQNDVPVPDWPALVAHFTS